MTTTYPTIEVARTEDNVRIAGTGITAFLQWEIGGKSGDEYEYTTTGELVIGEKQYQLYLHWSCQGNDISIMDGDDIAGTFKYKGNEVHVNMIVDQGAEQRSIEAVIDHAKMEIEKRKKAVAEVEDLKNENTELTNLLHSMAVFASNDFKLGYKDRTPDYEQAYQDTIIYLLRRGIDVTSQSRSEGEVQHA